MEYVEKIYSIRILSDSVYYKIVFLLWALLHNISFGARYTGYLSVIVIIWGMLLVIRNFFIEKARIPKILMYLIYVYLVSYLVTIAINRELNLVGNIKTLIWAIIMTLVLFVSEYSKDNKKVYRDIKFIATVLTNIITMISLISISMFIFDISYWIERVDGRMIPQGYYAARLWGIYVDPNQGCTIASVALILSLIVFIERKTINRVFIGISIIINYVFVVLTASRGGEVALIIVFIGFNYMIFDYLLKNRLRSDKFRKSVSILIGIIITIGMIASFSNTRKVLSYLPRATVETQQYINQSTGIQSGGSGGNVTVERPDTKSSNGRIELWIDGFKLIKFAPIFGFGDRNIMVKAAEFTPGSTLEKSYVHNGFIHMLLSGGLVATISMIIFISIIAINAMRIFFTNKQYNSKYYIYNFISLTVVVLLVAAIFLTEIFYQNSFIATAFWILMGNLVVLTDENKMILK